MLSLNQDKHRIWWFAGFGILTVATILASQYQLGDSRLKAKRDAAQAKHDTDELRADNKQLRTEIQALPKQITEQLKSQGVNVKIERKSGTGELVVVKETVARLAKEQESIKKQLPPPHRRIAPDIKIQMSKELSKVPGKVSISVIANNSEAYQFAQDFYDVLSAAGWNVKGINSFMYGGEPVRGVLLKVHGDPVPPGREVSVSGPLATLALAHWIRRISQKVSAQRYPDIPHDEVWIDIGLPD